MRLRIRWLAAGWRKSIIFSCCTAIARNPVHDMYLDQKPPFIVVVADVIKHGLEEVPGRGSTTFQKNSRQALVWQDHLSFRLKLN
jgi:hypothetical protein